MGKNFFAAMIAVVVAAFASYNMYQSQNTVALSDLALANVEALANDSETGKDRKCIQIFEFVYDQEMCNTNPVRYSTRSGTSYSLIKDINGTLSSGKSGFEGTIINECASNPSDEKEEMTAATVSC